MHSFTSLALGLMAAMPLVSAYQTMQYGNFYSPSANANQKVAWISGMDICTALVPVLAEGNQNACDIDFKIPSRASGYTFRMKDCDSNGIPQHLQVTTPGGGSYTENPNYISEYIGCKGGQQFNGGNLQQQFNLPF